MKIAAGVNTLNIQLVPIPHPYFQVGNVIDTTPSTGPWVVFNSQPWLGSTGNYVIEHLDHSNGQSVPVLATDQNYHLVSNWPTPALVASYTPGYAASINFLATGFKPNSTITVTFHGQPFIFGTDVVGSCLANIYNTLAGPGTYPITVTDGTNTADTTVTIIAG